MKRKNMDNSFKDYVLDQLCSVDGIDYRRMFGGYGIYQDGVFFGIIYKDCLYFKTTPESKPQYISRGMKPFVPTPKQTLKTYYEVPADVIDDRKQLSEWALTAASAGHSKAK
ncbi:MAG: TfoX/Sxy family protein [Planctomycetes bacterium]|nr:TfoX/Sxy family protein [Planctomycetota bacterium]